MLRTLPRQHRPQAPIIPRRSITHSSVHTLKIRRERPHLIDPIREPRACLGFEGGDIEFIAQGVHFGVLQQEGVHVPICGGVTDAILDQEGGICGADVRILGLWWRWGGGECALEPG